MRTTTETLTAVDEAGKDIKVIKTRHFEVDAAGGAEVERSATFTVPGHGEAIALSDTELELPDTGRHIYL